MSITRISALALVDPGAAAAEINAVLARVGGALSVAATEMKVSQSSLQRVVRRLVEAGHTIGPLATRGSPPGRRGGGRARGAQATH